MKRVLMVAAITGATTGLIVCLVAHPALAATSDVGRNLGDELKTWATTLLLVVAALVSIPILAKRDVNGGVVLALLVVLVGGFAFAPASVKQVITSLWHSIAGYLNVGPRDPDPVVRRRLRCRGPDPQDRPLPRAPPLRAAAAKPRLRDRTARHPSCRE